MPNTTIETKYETEENGIEEIDIFLIIVYCYLGILLLVFMFSFYKRKKVR